MELVSWNVNGIRACAEKGFVKWLTAEKPDVVCLQETKANQDQLDLFLTSPKGYKSWWHSAQKPGYSGVAIYSREEPEAVHEGIGVKDIDAEGRVLTAEFGKIVVVGAYFPNSQREKARLPYKLKFCDAILKHVNGYRKKGRHVYLCGDYNIAHKEIDLKNPKSNKDNAGFLPEERAWMDEFTQAGWVDTFRHVHGDVKDAYSWWSYRPGIRERNIGWRIDYFCCNKEAQSRIEDAKIHPDIFGSDHCPVSVRIKS